MLAENIDEYATDSDNCVSGELRLWKQVILLLVKDITDNRKLLKYKLNGSRALVLKELGEYKEIVDSHWFVQICDFAGKDPVKYRRLLNDIIDGRSMPWLPKRF